jgi:hypothetical protein
MKKMIVKNLTKMKAGDLVVLRGSLFSSWDHLNEVGTVISNDHFVEGLLVMFGGIVQDFSGHKDHFEVINES